MKLHEFYVKFYSLLYLHRTPYILIYSYTILALVTNMYHINTKGAVTK